MAANSKIEWTEATWNPIAGCTPISPGCLNCYAAQMAYRLECMGQEKYAGLTVLRNGVRTFNGKINTVEKDLLIPLRRKTPTIYFVNSMSDLFHEDVPESFIDRVFEVMENTPQHTYQILTKRADRMATYAHWRWGEGRIAPRNIWLGVSVENREQTKRIERIRSCAAVCFLSCEPLLQDLIRMDLSGIHWVIVGGESGPNARLCDAAWILTIISQCRMADVPVFVKQLGSNSRNAGILFDLKGGNPDEWPEELRIRQFPQPKEATCQRTEAET